MANIDVYLRQPAVGICAPQLALNGCGGGGMSGIFGVIGGGIGVIGSGISVSPTVADVGV